MTDLIKREDATKAMAKAVGRILYDAEEISRHVMNSIPSAEPTIEIDADQLAKLLREGWTIHSEPKQGEWIVHFDDLFPEESTEECSVCHAEQLINGNDDNFCPNCGARMKGADDE